MRATRATPEILICQKGEAALVEGLAVSTVLNQKEGEVAQVAKLSVYPRPPQVRAKRKATRHRLWNPKLCVKSWEKRHS